MKHCLKPVFAIFAVVFFAIAPGYASAEKSMVVSIETDSFKLTDTDISSLAIGESKTIETESGQVVDILRTVDEVEIYIDGELVDLGFDHDPESGIHMISKHVEVSCDDEDEGRCEKHVVIHTEGDGDTSAWSSDGDDGVIMHEEIEITCADDEGETDCGEHMVWVTNGREIDIDIESQHEEHVDGKGHKVVIIKKKTDSHD